MPLPPEHDDARAANTSAVQTTGAVSPEQGRSHDPTYTPEAVARSIAIVRAGVAALLAVANRAEPDRSAA